MRRMKPSWFTRSKVRLIALLLAIVPVVAPCQVQSGRSQKPPAKLRPVSLPHLYWHFLVFQNVLDSKAAELEAHGKDGRTLRNDLQMRMGFSDSDFAPVRASSVRLSSELKVLDAQAATVRAAGRSPANAAKLKALAAQREAYINAEISALKRALPPERIAVFEAFITRFFAPKPVRVEIIAPSEQTTPAAQP